MADFIKSITVDNELASFIFNKIYIPDGIKYFVTVHAKQGKFSFEMQQDSYGKWKIVSSVPDWVSPFESELASAIKDSTKFK